MKIVPLLRKAQHTWYWWIVLIVIGSFLVAALYKFKDTLLG